MARSKSNLGKVKKDFTVDKEVIEEFDTLIRMTSETRSSFIEKKMKEYIKKNRVKEE